MCRRFVSDVPAAGFGKKLCQLTGVPRKSVWDLPEVRFLRTAVHQGWKGMLQ